VEVNARIVLQELADRAGFVSREVVQDDVNLLVPGAEVDDFLEESDKLSAGVASGGFAVYSPGRRVQGCIKGQCSVTVVFKSVALGAAWGKGQHRV
jgi:hypothetical protein